jgi:hypothetical protein
MYEFATDGKKLDVAEMPNFFSYVSSVGGMGRCLGTLNVSARCSEEKLRKRA